VTPTRVPVSTYRVQVTADLDLHAVAGLLPYLQRLGVDWVYLSPILAAEPGSTHGYDVVAFDRIDASRGGPEGLAAVSSAARSLGMGVLVDIVPNHVGVATPHENAAWWDLLQHGRDSSYASFFDVDWDAGADRIRIPVLAEDADLDHDLSVVDGELRYFDHRYPLAPGTDGGSPLEVHTRQHYELVSWTMADHALNYRRFFAVNTLAGVRVEDPAVLDATHVEVKRWFDEGLVDGLRVDHPDGLRDPGGYLAALAGLTRSAYVLVEKILETGEELPRWETAGTTGYDALALIDRVLTDGDGVARLPYAALDWAALTHGTKRAIADGILGSEVRRVVRELTSQRAEQPLLVDAVAELCACFPVYRSYLPEGRDHLEHAFTAARDSRTDLADAFDELWPVLSDADHPAAQRFQQTTGAVMAKGVEDTAFYRVSRLTSLTEVGADPSVTAVSVGDFHEAMASRQRDWPAAMTTLSTHDTKRGEDVRARIAVLAELPDLWADALDRLSTLVPLPDGSFANLLWQAAVGAWPISRERLHAYAEKAMREAGDRTQWTRPDTAYEDAVHAAVDAAFDDESVAAVLEEVGSAIASAGEANSLSAKLLSLAIPGVPDVYQGSELEERSLVDPDNRRHVDFGRLDSLLDAAMAGDPAPAKLRVTTLALRLRRDRPELFGSYAAVPASGSAADHVVAFDRGGAIAVTTRLPVGLEALGGWSDTTVELPAGDWHDVLTDRPASTSVGELLSELPVALLVRSER
jgi:(1->4)-alpha-D-glucan 1-alpha-D-glucosylmutase